MISVVLTGSLRCWTRFWRFMKFLLSSCRLNQEHHAPDHLRPFLWREISHRRDLRIRALSFDNSNKAATLLSDRDPFPAPIPFIFAPVDHASYHELIKQAAGSRKRTPQQLSHPFNRLFAFFSQDEYPSHLRQ